MVPELPAPQTVPRTLALSALAVTAFAANSILCRHALATADIDPVGFTTIRLASGAATLLAVARLSGRRRTERSQGTWVLGGALFAYAILFSLAYVRLGVGTGVLILFPTVQVTMIAWGLVRGERPRPVHWAGLAVALAGLIHLVSPGVAAPSPAGSLMMAGAGLAWGVYSLRGRRTTDPVVSTTDNFVRSVPLVLVVAVLFRGTLGMTARGVVLAIVSGAVASGLGYVVWYAALRGLSATRAASVQLAVPAVAALGGLLFLGEPLTLRIALSGALILGGVALTLVGRERAAPAAAGSTPGSATDAASPPSAS